MTVDEFDIQFDILYNNISSNAAPGLDAYEKSVFLSQAHKDIVTDLYSGKSVAGISFESTEEARAYLKDYIKSNSQDLQEGLSINKSCKYTLSTSEFNDSLFRLKESVSDNNNNYYMVIPARQDEIINLLKNPFRGPNNDRVLRVDEGLDAESQPVISLYSANKLDTYLDTYYVTYICKPEPIILKGIDEKLFIEDVEITKDISDNGYIGNAPEILHSTILKLAVALAKQAYIGQ
jgi:hypothetical protein